jgi:hypothetical protein
MDRKSIEQLRMDRRLIGRKNWTAPKDFEREVEALPDVSHKIAEVGEQSDPGKSNPDLSSANPPDAGSPIADYSIPSHS